MLPIGERALQLGAVQRLSTRRTPLGVQTTPLDVPRIARLVEADKAAERH